MLFGFLFVVLGMLGGKIISAEEISRDKEMVFDGSNYQDLPGVGMQGSRSIEFWFNSDVAAQDVDAVGGEFAFFDWTGRGGFVRCYYTGKYKRVFFVRYSTSWKGAAGLCRFASNEWVHVVCVFDEKDNGMRLYINGNLMPGGATSNPFPAGASVLRIGAQLNGIRYFKGKIKGFKIYDKALTQEEVLENYQKSAEKSFSLNIPLPKMVSEENLRKLTPIIIEGEDFVLTNTESGLRTNPNFSGGKAQTVGREYLPPDTKVPDKLTKEFNVPKGKYWIFLKGYCSQANLRAYKVEIDGASVEKKAPINLLPYRGNVDPHENSHKYHLLYLGAIGVEKSPAVITVQSLGFTGAVDCIYLLPITERIIAKMKEMPEKGTEKTVDIGTFKVDLSPEYKGLDQGRLNDLVRMQTPDITNLFSYSIDASYAKKEKEYIQPQISEAFAFKEIEGKPFRYAFPPGNMDRLIDSKTGSDILKKDFIFTWDSFDLDFLKKIDELGYPFTCIEEERCGFGAYKKIYARSLQPIPDDQMEEVRKLKHFMGFNLRESVGGITSLIDDVYRHYRILDHKMRWGSEGYWIMKQHARNLPKTKEEAFATERDCRKWLIGTLGRKVTEMTTEALPHLICLTDREAVSLLTTEIGSPAIFYQYLTSATRGAARQFGLPWGHYIAQYGGNSYQDGKQYGSWGTGDRWNPFGGLSLSLLRRAFYFSYISGANVSIPEGMSGTALLISPGNNINYLNPRGKIIKEWRDFTLKHPDRGVPFTPCAILLDPVEGCVSPNQWTPREHSWQFLFPYEKQDYMADKFFGTIWPGTFWSTLDRFLPPKDKEEEYYKNQDVNLYYRGPFELMRQQSHLVNTPYGDVFDILVSQKLSPEVLNSYSVIFLLGKIRMDETLKTRLMNYVREGGKIVMTTYHTKNFSKKILPVVKGNKDIFEKNYGKGRVFVINSEFLMDEKGNIVPFLSGALHSIIDPLIPFKITKIKGGENDPDYSRDIPGIENAPVQYLMSRNEKGWVITLINNNGVHESDKQLSPIMVYPKGEVEIEVTYKGKASKVTDWLKDEEVKIDGAGEWTSLRLTIPPGHIRILEFVTGKVSPQ